MLQRIGKISLLVLISVIFLFGCGKKVDLTEGNIGDYHYSETDEVTNYVKMVVNKNKVVLIELYPDIAPITVENFKKLVSEKFYDDMIFHRVIADFMIQTGDPTKAKNKKSSNTIKGEFSDNGVTNTLKHDKGIVSMARSDDMNSASSQFFICVNDNNALNYLDGKYAAFGKVIAGYDNVLTISNTSTDTFDAPITNQTLNSIRFVKISKN